MNKRIAYIQHFCKDYTAFSPEGLLFGAATLITISSAGLEQSLTDLSEEDLKALRSERRKARSAFRSNDLDLGLVRKTAPILKKDFPGKASSEFYKKLKKVPDSASLQDIVSFIIENLDERYLKAVKELENENCITSFPDKEEVIPFPDESVSADIRKELARDAQR